MCCIAEEHTRNSFAVQLRALRVVDVRVPLRPEHTEILQRWASYKAHLIWSFARSDGVGDHIDDEHRCVHCLCSPALLHALVVQHRTAHFCDHSIHPLSKSVLLWRVRRRRLVHDVVLAAERTEALVHEFSTTVDAKALQLGVELFLYHHAIPHNVIRHFSLAREEVNRCEARKVVDQGERIPSSTWGFRVH